MPSKNLSSIATDVIHTYGITATNIINTYRFGGERIVGYVDDRFAQVVNRGASALRKDLRSNLIAGQQRLSGYYVRGVHFGTERAQNVVGIAVDLATRSVGLVSENASRIGRAANLDGFDTLNSVVMPAAQIVVRIAERIEEGSSTLVQRVAGKPVPAKAVATRKLNATKRKAAATRKRVTKTATRKASQAVADAATETSNAARRLARKSRSATRQVNAAVADVAADTANTARRAARRTRSATRTVNEAVAGVAGKTSNAARRVARKGASIASAAA